MKDLIKKIFKKRDSSGSRTKDMSSNYISDTTDAVFKKYKKSFKDLARYDREEKVGIN
ncbi:MAG: hypothetical protein AAB595_01115 [Patescibacteria group bacterium]